MPSKHTSVTGLWQVVEWRAVAHRWPYIAVATCSACLLASLYIAVSKPAYEAETRVVIQNVGLGLNADGGGSTYDKEFLSTQAEIIRSPATISRSLTELPPLIPPSSGADPFAAITENLRVNPLASTDIVRVTFQHHDPEHAVQRLESIIESYRSHLRSVEQSSTSHSVELLNQRSSELEQQIADLQQQLRLARSSGDLLLPIENGTNEKSPVLDELLTRWATMQTQLASVEASLVADDGPALATSIAEFNSEWSNELSRLQSEVTLVQVQVEELARIYGPAHSERIAIEQRQSSLKSLYAARELEVRSSLLAQKARIERELVSLGTLLTDEQDRMATLAGIRLDELKLQDDLTRVGELHASTVQTLEALRLADRTIAQGRGSIRVEVLDAYAVPRVPIWPKPIPLLGTAALLGALLGLAVVVLMEATKNRNTLSRKFATPSVAESEVLQSIQKLQDEVRAAVASPRRDESSTVGVST